MPCRDICLKIKLSKTVGQSPYALGGKRCYRCEVWIVTEDRMCPCCHYQLRVRPGTSPSNIRKLEYQHNERDMYQKYEEENKGKTLKARRRWGAKLGKERTGRKFKDHTPTLSSTSQLPLHQTSYLIPHLAPQERE